MASAPKRKIRVVALTPQGGALARTLCRALPGAGCWLPRAAMGRAAGRMGTQTGANPTWYVSDPRNPARCQEFFATGWEAVT